MRIHDVKYQKQADLLSLTRQWWKWGWLSFGVLLPGFFFLRNLWQPQYAWRWFGQTAVVWVFVFLKIRRALVQNHRKQSTHILATFGIGTHITIVRGLLLAALAGFLFLPLTHTFWLRWIPPFLYLFAAGADYLDGYLARITNHETCLGALLDMQLDALGLLIAPLLAVTLGQLPIFYLSASGAYYAVSLGKKIRHFRGKPVFAVPPWPGARMLAGFQMGLVGTALFPIFSPTVTTIAAAIFLPPFLAGFVKDWLILSGRIDPHSLSWRQHEQRIARIVSGYMPVILRCLLLIPGLFLLRDWMIPHSLTLAALLLIFLGIVGRLAALLLSLWLGILLIPSAPLWLWWLFSGGVVILLTGTGRFSFWQPEEQFLFKHAGEHH